MCSRPSSLASAAPPPGRTRRCQIADHRSLPRGCKSAKEAHADHSLPLGARAMADGSSAKRSRLRRVFAARAFSGALPPLASHRVARVYAAPSASGYASWLLEDSALLLLGRRPRGRLPATGAAAQRAGLIHTSPGGELLIAPRTERGALPADESSIQFPRSTSPPTAVLLRPGVVAAPMRRRLVIPSRLA